MNYKPILLLILPIFIMGCIEEIPKETEEKVIYNYKDFIRILEQKNPKQCFDFNDETVNESFAKEYVMNIEKVDEEILFKDLCLIYTISIAENNTKPNVNDEFIILCNEASDRNYRFLEEGSYEIPAWNFCFRMAFDEWRSYLQPPRTGEIRNKETCDKLKTGRDNCLWLVAKNGDISVCDLMRSERNKEKCKEEFQIK